MHLIHQKRAIEEWTWLCKKLHLSIPYYSWLWHQQANIIKFANNIIQDGK
jgi:hypothetical protein